MSATARATKSFSGTITQVLTREDIVGEGFFDGYAVSDAALEKIGEGDCLVMLDGHPTDRSPARRTLESFVVLANPLQDVPDEFQHVVLRDTGYAVGDQIDVTARATIFVEVEN